MKNFKEIHKITKEKPFTVAEGGELFTLEGEHWVAKSIKLNAFTDDNDTLTAVNEQHLFARNLYRAMQGDLFFLEDLQSGEAIVILSENADFNLATLSIEKGPVTVDSQGCKLAVGFCRVGECERACRAYLRETQQSRGLITMSNTWGDRNGSTRVCRDFVLREMDAAARIGLDIVQIDDGWQMGDTAWKSERDSFGRTFGEGYWDCNHERFPEELRPMVEYAAARGMQTGMWFAPDWRDGYAHFERDIAVLKKAYEEWGIRFFKLDMYYVCNEADKAAMLKMLAFIYSLGNDVTVQMDVTRGSRLNYLCGRQYGTVFVENRYTGSGNSFPHRILRNLWMISRYLPTSRFQFELVNPDLNAEMYGPEDPFAPHRYDMDYLFATVMLSNPLFWMEVQFLSEKRQAELAPLMRVWKEHRGAFGEADIAPIGEKPSGRSFSGFAVSRGGKAEYLLIFREVTQNETAEIAVDAEGTCKVLASNAACTAVLQEGKLKITLDKPRAYALLQLQ